MTNKIKWMFIVSFVINIILLIRYMLFYTFNPSNYNIVSVVLLSLMFVGYIITGIHYSKQKRITNDKVK